MLNRLRRPFAQSVSRLCAGVATALLLTVSSFSAQAEGPLKIGFSDWPGWTPWQIAVEKGWFKEAGVEVELLWFDYVESMDTYAAGKIDAVCMTNGDALVTGATGRPSVAIIINDFSNGNDMLVAAPGIKSAKDLKGKKIGAELGFVGHLLALTALEDAGLGADDVTWVNVPTDETPQVLASGAVDAVAAWQPNSGNALKSVSGATAIYTSASKPGIIYDVLAVAPESLAANKEDWAKVVGVWYKIVDYIKDPKNMDEALGILSKRVGVSPEEYEPFFNGTYILTLEEALMIWEKGDGLESIYGSTKYVDGFNVAEGVYEKPLAIESYVDPTLTKAYAGK